MTEQEKKEMTISAILWIVIIVMSIAIFGLSTVLIITALSVAGIISFLAIIMVFWLCGVDILDPDGIRLDAIIKIF